MPNPPAKSVLEIIFDWSKQRPLWQRDALRRIILGGTLNDADIAELVILCKKEKGGEGILISPVPLAENDLPANPGAGEAITLSSLAEVSGVNQLAASQSIPFETKGITIIYGDNGAGKSGYARVLKRACRARYTGQIMPDAFNPSASPVAKASMIYESSGVAAPAVPWIDDGKPHPILSAISVFDRECGAVHVREKNEVAFWPFGLDIPDDLADGCQRVKTLLSAEQAHLEQSRDVIFTKPTWKPATRVGSILSALRANTDLDALTKLAIVTPAERERHRRLSEDLSKDPLKAAAEQILLADQLHQLRVALERAAAENDDARLQAIKALADDARSKRMASGLAAKRAFAASSIDGIGGQIWRALWDAARRYSERVAYVGRAFPPTEEDALCVLCQQPLTSDALTRFTEFDAFIQRDTEQQAQKAEQRMSDARKTFDSSRIHILSIAAIHQRLVLADPALGKAALRFLASARQRQAVCRRALDEDAALALPAWAESPIEKIRELEDATRRYAAELRQAADVEGRKRLEAERDELADRLALDVLEERGRAEVARLKALTLVAACIGDTGTTAITRLGNEIADKVITPKIRDQFQDEIVRLAANKVRVEIVRAGGKFGSPFYQVRLFANANAPVHDVLSEGEQTCVALAAFLTELATAAHQSALVFDDPVSSLDHRWRQKVAQRLVEETGIRQIVVFTHDLVFLNDIKDFAEKENKRVQLITLSRGPEGAGVVTLGLPWLAASVKSRVDALEKEVRAAKSLDENRDEAGYERAVFRIYSNLRNTWERAIEDVAFYGVINRHRDYVNTKNLRKVTVLNEQDCAAFDVGFQKCCDQTDSHDLSRARNAAPPPPDDMMRDVQAVLAWVDSIRTRQNRVA
jgi:energy-coupling factor transporter ATP-binding protein EcfA2